MIQNYSKSRLEYKKTNSKLKVAIVRSNYHQDLTKSLEASCRKYLTDCAVRLEDIKTFEVPGSWEIPLIVKKIALSKKFDGIVVFGVIIKGETHHFELIANECARSLMNLSLEFNIPITFEVLAVYNLEQAKKRCVGKFNKGVEAGKSLLETIKEISLL